MTKNKHETVRLTNDRFLGSSFSMQIYYQIINSTSKLHWHEFYELCYILKGSGTNVVNGVSFPLKEGSLFLLTPADFHEIYSDEWVTMELYNVVFSDDMITDALRSLLFLDKETLMFDFDLRSHISIEKEFRLIESELENCKVGYPILVKGSLERILIEALRSVGTYEPERDSLKPYSSMISKALIHMQHHFRENLSLQDVARQVQLAPNYFSECFRKSVGVSYQYYLQELRISFARTLLRASALSQR